MPGGGAASNYPMVKNSVPAMETLTVPAGYVLIAGNGFTVDGDLQIDGDFIMVG